MSNEELLNRRYKVIAKGSKNYFIQVGDILVCVHGKYWNTINTYYLVEEEIQKLPHIYKRLEWWEERGIADIPGYVWFKKEALVSKVLIVYSDMSVEIDHPILGSRTRHLSDCKPATEEEYIKLKAKLGLLGK